jgi:chromosome partitioning protein
MKVWTIVNQKGGVGKTTTTVSLAGALARIGKKVLLVDLDPQASLTHYVKLQSNELPLTVYDVFVAKQNPPIFPEIINKTIIHSGLNNIDIMPSHMALATLDGAMHEQAGKGLIVRDMLASFNENKADTTAQYDYVIIDCQPVLGILMINALVAAHTIVMPTQTEHLSLLGLNKMLATIEQMRSVLSPKVVSLIVPTLFDRRVNACLSAYSVMRNTYKSQLWRGYIPIDTKFRDASVMGLPISDYAENARGTFAYEKLMNTLVNHD